MMAVGSIKGLIVFFPKTSDGETADIPDGATIIGDVEVPVSVTLWETGAAKVAGS